MFSNFLEVLQGPSVNATDDSAATEQGNEEGLTADIAKSSKEGTSENAKMFDFWGVANALADSVKKTTADISASVGETDWKAELEAFSKGVREDANEVQRHAHKAARDGASRLEHLPKQAANAKFPKVDPEKVKTQFDQVGSRIGKLGNRVLTSSKDLFEQVAEALQTELDGIEGHVRKPKGVKQALTKGQGQAGAPKYSRLEADISAMQRSSSTYCDQPEDTQDFEAWLKDFDLEEKAEEIEAITRDNTFMAELQSRIVPLIVQYNTFWTRYFYQLHKLKQKHHQMQSVVQRAAQSPTEQVSWDDEDGDRDPAPQQKAVKQEGRMGRDFSPVGGKAALAAKQSLKVKPSLLPKGEDEPDTSTASDDSGNGPWTVVTSPTHKRTESVEANSRPSPVPEEPVATQNSPHKEVFKAPADESKADNEEAESDIDVSDDNSQELGEKDASDVEEDWGLWD